MKVIKISSQNLNRRIIEEVLVSIKKGSVAIFPTDTVYGLICDAKNKKAVEKIFKIKKRPRGKPISIFVKDIKMAKKFAEINGAKEKFLRRVWPGTVTAVLKSKGDLPKNIFQGKGTIGVRIPNYKLVLNLIDKINRPLAETSANVSGRPASTKIKEVLKQFKCRNSYGPIRIPRSRAVARLRVGLFACPDLVLDAGNLKPSKPSTVIDLTRKKPKILRQGDFNYGLVFIPTSE